MSTTEMLVDRFETLDDPSDIELEAIEFGADLAILTKIDEPLTRKYSDLQIEETKELRSSGQSSHFVVNDDDYSYWGTMAACRDSNPNVFFHDQTEIDLTETAKNICGSCAVRSQCLDYALANKIEEGIWGGYTEKERRRIKRKGLQA
jgi:WhiB family redox-sensing transcriptional regulator